MTITITSEVADPTGTMSCWTIAGRDALVEALAWLYLQRQAHAISVLEELEPGRAVFIGSEIDNAVDSLTYRLDDIREDLAGGDEEKKTRARQTLATRVAHRDGLLFQHISWLAARLKFPDAEASAPHVRSADKGFDGFFLEYVEGQGALAKIILCEDKASTSPRSVITAQVWPEIQEIEAGAKDREIIASVMALMPNVSPEQREEIIGATLWSQVKHYRVAVAASPRHLRDGKYTHLFKGFEEKAAGDVSIRLGEVLPLQEIRKDLEGLANDIVHRLEGMRKGV